MVSVGPSGPDPAAPAALSLYGPEGWTGQRYVEAVSGTAGSGGSEAVLTSAEVSYRQGNASITVGSHRQGGSGPASLRRWVWENASLAASAEQADDESGRPPGAGPADWRQAPDSRGEPAWQDVTIPLDGQPAAFQLAAVSDGWWVAAGQAPDADLTLDSRHVPVARLALVRVTDLPVPELPVFQRPRRPARQLPVDTGPAEAIPGHARIDLSYERSGLLSGSAGGQPVRLELSIPAHSGAVAGTVAGVPVAARWENADNSRAYPDVTADLAGSFGGQAVQLHATMHLEPGYFFDRGTVTGQIGAAALTASVESASGGLGGAAVAVDGTLGRTEFTIYATLAGSLDSGQIRGTVAGLPVRIDAVRTRRADRTAQTRLTGSFPGPPALLALVSAALLYFI